MIGRFPQVLAARAEQIAFDGMPAGRCDFDSRTPLSVDEAKELLANFRDAVVEPAAQNWEAGRSILRDSMIEMFVAQTFDDAEDWAKKVPMYLRQGTAPGEKKHLDSIAAIVARIAKH